MIQKQEKKKTKIKLRLYRNVWLKLKAIIKQELMMLKPNSDTLTRRGIKDLSLI
jgi:hypothetical protein